MKYYALLQSKLKPLLFLKSSPVNLEVWPTKDSTKKRQFSHPNYLFIGGSDYSWSNSQCAFGCDSGCSNWRTRKAVRHLLFHFFIYLNHSLFQDESREKEYRKKHKRIWSDIRAEICLLGWILNSGSRQRKSNGADRFQRSKSLKKSKLLSLYLLYGYSNSWNGRFFKVKTVQWNFQLGMSTAL